MPPGNQPRESASAGSCTGTASAVFHLDTASSWVFLIRKDGREPIPLLQTPQDDKEQTRRKFLPMIQYILELRQAAATTAYEEKFRKQHPPVDQFFTEYDDLPDQQKRLFARNADKNFLVHLGQAQNAAQARAGELGCRITRLLVPFPSTWTRWMQKYYAAYFRIAWKLDPELIYESEAIAHFVVSKSMTAGFESKRFRKLIVVDLGAQILSMSTFHLTAHRTDPASFHLYSETNDISVYSGTDLHAELMGSIIRSYMDANRRSLSKSDEEKLVKKFTASYMQHCDAMVKGDGFIMCAASSTTHQISVSDEDSRSMYNRCFSNVFETLRKTLNASKAKEDPNKTEVVLVGVGFQNKSIREKVEEQVKALDFLLHDPTTLCLDTTQPSIVAVGAACAIKNASTVEEFMQAACFVVRGSRDAKTPNETIWSSGSSKTARVSVSEEDETLIVKCSPVPKTPPAAGMDETLFYDFSELKLPCGDYDIRMEFQAPPTNGYLVTIFYKDRRRHAGDGGETEDGSREYRIYYDYGSRLCFEDIDKSASRYKNDQATRDSEELEALLLVTDETLEARILALTKYRAGAAGRATLSAL
ncbi:hypothetical protein MY11210_009299 [Beauveria gryllotalpidicola]